MTSADESVPLPNWKLWTLCALAVIVSAGWAWQRVAFGGADPMDEYAREVRAMQREILRRAPGSPASESDLRSAAADPAVRDEGREIFRQNCASCHGAEGGGLVGPNLTDAHWLHGSSAIDVYVSVFDGHPVRGMPPWGPSLGARRVRAVTAFVESMRNTNVPDGREPQGVRAP